MTTLADSKLSALETLTGNTGHINDLEAEYLVLLGATALTIVDMWHEVFDNAAIPAGQHNDRWMAYMDSILSPATEDAYNDREREFWDAGGTPLVPALPPALANLIHWYDFDDLTTLFQDLAGSTPVTTPGQFIRRVNDKGTVGTDLTDTSAGTFRSPFWEISGGTGEYDPKTGFNKVLSGTEVPGLAGSERSFGWVANRNQAGASGTAYVSAWQNLGLTIGQFDSNIYQGWSSSQGLNTAVVPKAILLGALLTHALPSAQQLRISHLSGFVSLVNAIFTNPTANQDLSVGALNAGSGNNWEGIIKAVFYWDKALSAAETASFKAFTTGKYGVVWA